MPSFISKPKVLLLALLIGMGTLSACGFKSPATDTSADPDEVPPIVIDQPPQESLPTTTDLDSLEREVSTFTLEEESFQ
jgi:hypothetical protein